MMQKKREARAAGRKEVLIIKPTDSSTFGNIVDLIDEAHISNYSRYFLDKMSVADEEKLLRGKQ